MFPSTSTSTSPSVLAAGVTLPLLGLDDPHGLSVSGFPPLASFHLTVPLVSPAIRVFGFAAMGNAGNASPVAPPFARPIVAALDTGRDDAGDGRVDDGAAQGTGPTRPAPARLADAAGMAGKGLAFTALFQLPCLLTAERDDWAVELFSLRTRWPPLPAAATAAADEPGKTPLGPGSEG